ncbi:MAG: sigma-70 family RNA polymerase sigma factor [Oscillospiraceae bacterium]|nr:sigma-70 family RNA polymerase sigma factor [Oscillospiraceae bacterium]
MFPVVILLIRDENEQAKMTEIFENYGPYVYSCIDKYLSSSVSHDDRSDIFQDVIERLIKHIEALMDLKGGQLCSYIQMTAKSVVSDFVRKRAKNAVESLELLAENGFESEDHETPPVYEHLETAEDRKKVWKVMRLLPQREREVLILKYFYEKPDAEIAAELGISKSGVRACLARGRAKLLELWKQKEEQQ